MTHALLSFAVVAGLLTIIPGMDNALVLRAALGHRRGTAFATAAGILTGSLVWGITAAAGVSVLLTASRLGYTALRIAGAAYLVWLGCGMLRSAFRRDPVSIESVVDSSGGMVTAWAKGLGTNLLNPKVGVFYVAMLPQFIPAGSAHLVMGTAMAVVHDIEGLVWFTVLICAAGVLRRWLGRPGVRRALDALTGTVLVGFGVRLAVSQR